LVIFVDSFKDLGSDSLSVLCVEIICKVFKMHVVAMFYCQKSIHCDENQCIDWFAFCVNGS